MSALQTLDTLTKRVGKNASVESGFSGSSEETNASK